MALLTESTPPTRMVCPIWSKMPFFCAILKYSSYLAGVYSEVISIIFPFLISNAEESPTLATVSYPLATIAIKHVLPSVMPLAFAILRNFLSRVLIAMETGQIGIYVTLSQRLSGITVNSFLLK
jgi:hypothetical protein